MKKPAEAREALLTLETRLGDRSVQLRLGSWVIEVDGIDDDLVDRLERRWGGFVTEIDSPKPRATLTLFPVTDGLALGAWSPGETYTLEAEVIDGDPVVRSHHFVVAPDPGGPDHWRAGVVRSDRERPDRIVENIVRYLVCRLAVQEGGLALHAAGVLKRGQAFVFAGPSGSGKTTAVELSAPAISLGDDFAIVFPEGETWQTAAVPFDNRESAPGEPPRGTFPVAGVWRLYHAPRARVECPPPARSVASLMGCAAFPWAMPDLSDRVLENAWRFIGESVFAHLHFAKESGFWTLIEG